MAAALSAVATPLVRALARRLGAVDRRDGGRAIPRLGGLAVLLATLVALASAHVAGLPPITRLASTGSTLAWLGAAVALVTAAGIWDDVRDLRASTKLAVELAAALLVVAGGHGIAGVTDPLTGAYVGLGPLAPVVTVLWILVITNAFNLIDGLDGLAAGTGVIASLTLLVIAVAQSRFETVPLWCALAGALLGFLPYNFPPASVFLGDTGSLVLGFIVAVLAIESVAKGPATLVVLAPIAALGLPITDVVLAVVRRTQAAGLRAVFRRDRQHIHHRLLAAGLSERDAVLSLYAVSATGGALAVAAVVARGAADLLLVAVIIATVWLAVRFLAAAARPR